MTTLASFQPAPVRLADFSRRSSRHRSPGSVPLDTRIARAFNGAEFQRDRRHPRAGDCRHCYCRR